MAGFLACGGLYTSNYATASDSTTPIIVNINIEIQTLTQVIVIVEGSGFTSDVEIEILDADGNPITGFKVEFLNSGKIRITLPAYIPPGTPLCVKNKNSGKVCKPVPDFNSYVSANDGTTGTLSVWQVDGQGTAPLPPLPGSPHLSPGSVSSPDFAVIGDRVYATNTAPGPTGILHVVRVDLSKSNPYETLGSASTPVGVGTIAATDSCVFVASDQMTNIAYAPVSSQNPVPSGFSIFLAPWGPDKVKKLLAHPTKNVLYALLPTGSLRRLQVDPTTCALTGVVESGVEAGAVDLVMNSKGTCLYAVIVSANKVISASVDDGGLLSTQSELTVSSPGAVAFANWPQKLFVTSFEGSLFRFKSPSDCSLQSDSETLIGGSLTTVGVASKNDYVVFFGGATGILYSYDVSTLSSHKDLQFGNSTAAGDIQ